MKTLSLEKVLKVLDDQSAIYHNNMEGCDEPEFSQYDFALSAIDNLKNKLKRLNKQRKTN